MVKFMNDKKNEYQYQLNICYMPNGQPVPEVLTEEDLIKLLRLDEDGTDKSANTLRYYREKNLLRATQIGKKLRYIKQEVLNFLALQTERTNKHSA
jgi:hypothetical protein